MEPAVGIEPTTCRLRIETSQKNYISDIKDMINISMNKKWVCHPLVTRTWK